jgi:hypothetical protein
LKMELLMALGLHRVHLGIGDDDNAVAHLGETRGSAVDAKLAGTARCRDGVGREPLAIIDVEHIDLLIGQDAGGFQQVQVDRDRAFIVKVGLGHRGAVELGFHHFQTHGEAFERWQCCGAYNRNAARDIVRVVISATEPSR